MIDLKESALSLKAEVEPPNVSKERKFLDQREPFVE
jgi:hypothetical protein